MAGSQKTAEKILVTFTRTGERRYRVSVDGPGEKRSQMEPAPGYDPRLPHDMAHFVVENELGIGGGVFGQLAAGGTARTFSPNEGRSKRKALTRGRKLAAANRDDALLSEKIIAIACGRWNSDPLAPTERGVVSEAEIERILNEFDRVSERWSRLAIGESMTLEWKGGVSSVT